MKDTSDQSALGLVIVLGLNRSGYLTTSLWDVRHSKATLVLSPIDYGTQEIHILIIFFSLIHLKHYSKLVFASKIELLSEWPRSKIVWSICCGKVTS